MQYLTPLEMDASPLASTGASLSTQLAVRCSADWTECFSAEERSELTGIVRRALLDTAACILAGRDDPGAVVIANWARPLAAMEGSSTVGFGGVRTHAMVAALLNGVAGHALDYDDVGLAGHPSVVLVPALLAECERTGIRGFALVQAYAKGYAVWGELERRLKVSLHARGWHPTAVFGALAAATGVAALRALDSASITRVLGIAASLAGGVVANFGSMTKALHIGRAAAAGIQAVDLTQAGLDASVDAIDGKAGLLVALAGDPSRVDLNDEVPQTFEQTLLLRRPGIKRYPVCYALHRIVDGVLALREQSDFSIQQVKCVDATISATAAAVLRHHDPRSAIEARFSAEFALASALLHGRLGMAEVSAAVVQDPQVRRLMSLVRIHTIHSQCPLEPSFAYTDQITVTFHDGRTLDSGPIRFALGHAENPLSEHHVRDKLLACVRAGEEALARRVLQQMDDLVRDGF